MISEMEAINMKKTEGGKKLDENRMDVDPKDGVKSNEYKPPVGTRVEKMKKVETKPALPIKVSKVPKPLPAPVVEPKKRKTMVQDVPEKSS
jgi:hypothetical protein